MLCIGATRRPAWDLKGKVSDMEGKLSNFQSKVKSVNQENESLKGSMAQTRSRIMEMESELESQRSQIRYNNQSMNSKTLLRKNHLDIYPSCIVTNVIGVFGVH